jgi:preprotein translocase subunit YajC
MLPTILLPAPLLSLPATASALQEEAPKAAQKGWGGDFWVLLVALVAVFYFVMILPEKKNRKKRTDMLGALKKGDKVMTTGGLYGTVATVQNDVVTLQVADGVRMRFNRIAIQTVLTEEPEGAGAKEPGAAS